MKRNHYITIVLTLLMAVFLFGCQPKASFSCIVEIEIEANTTFDVNDICTLSDVDGTAVTISETDITIGSNLDLSTLGVYDTRITIDALGIKQSKDVLVSVVDNTPPVITLNGDDHIKIGVGSVYVDAGASAVDNLDGVVRVTIDQSDLDVDTFGEYIITYHATDEHNNTQIQYRTVEVGDVQAPFVGLIRTYKYYGNGEIDYEALIDYITDDYSTEFVIEIDDSDVNLSRIGNYTTLYSVSDQSGNTTIVQLTVQVVAPTFVPFTVETVERYPGGLSLDIDFPEDEVEDVYLSIVDRNTGETVPGFTDIPITNGIVSIENLPPSRDYGCHISYKRVLDTTHTTLYHTEDYIYSTVAHYIHQNSLQIYGTALRGELFLDYGFFEYFVQTDIVEVETNTVVQTFTGSPSGQLKVEDLEPETEYRIDSIFTHGWTESISFTTMPLLERDNITIRFHYLDDDGEYTGSGVVLTHRHGEVLIPFTQQDDLGGYAELTLPYTTLWFLDEEVTVGFFNDIDQREPYQDRSFDILSYGLSQQVYEEVDYYYFKEGSDLLVTSEQETLVLLHFGASTMFAASYYFQHTGYVYVLNDSFDEHFLFPLVGNSDFLERYQTTNDVDVPYVIAPLLLPNDTSFVTVRLRAPNGNAFFDYELDVSDQLHGGVTELYLIEDLGLDPVSDVEFFDFLAYECVPFTYYGIRVLDVLDERVYIQFKEELPYEMWHHISVVTTSELGDETVIINNKLRYEILHQLGDTFFLISLGDLRYEPTNMVLVVGDHILPLSDIDPQVGYELFGEEPMSGEIQLYASMEDLEANQPLWDEPYLYEIETGDGVWLKLMITEYEDVVLVPETGNYVLFSIANNTFQSYTITLTLPVNGVDYQFTYDFVPEETE